MSNFELKRYPDNPVLPSVKNTWMEDQTANPDLLLINDIYYMYFRGQQNEHDRIGVATIPKNQFDGIMWNIHPDAIIDVGVPGTWDEEHTLDPATVYVDGTVYLYYSAVGNNCSRSICIATSKDGINFTKYEDNPIVIGGGPEVVYKDGIFYLYFWKNRPGRKGFQLHLSTSQDGFNYTEYQEEPVLPASIEDSWDSFTVETPRIFKENETYYMLYCGSDCHEDYPANAGLATSKDLIHWEKYDKNPIFSRGKEGEWDEGAIWFTTVEKINGIYYLWYEGYGGGTARTEEYGSYLKGGKSQVGMATMKADYFFVKP
jgi:beta-1,2-mannobiose phosphorylase / 1,2-beta-oligomannan phosphorylase